MLQLETLQQFNGTESVILFSNGMVEITEPPEAHWLNHGFTVLSCTVIQHPAMLFCADEAQTQSQCF